MVPEASVRVWGIDGGAAGAGRYRTQEGGRRGLARKTKVGQDRKSEVWGPAGPYNRAGVSNLLFPFFSER